MRIKPLKLNDVMQKGDIAIRINMNGLPEDSWNAPMIINGWAGYRVKKLVRPPECTSIGLDYDRYIIYRIIK